MKYQIGTFEFDPETNTLSSGEGTVSLENRTSRVLTYFCQNPGRTISRDELLDNVWGRNALSDHSVAIVISDLRKALGEDPKEPRYIKTIPKKGYVFQFSAETADTPAKPVPQRKNWGVAAGFLVIVVVAVYFSIFNPTDVEPATTVITVSDIRAGDLAPEVSYLPDTLTEIVVSELARYPDIGVKRLRGPLRPDISGLILSGSLSREEGRLVLAMQLEDYESGLVVWGNNATLTGNDFYQLTRDFAGQTANALGIAGAPVLVRQSSVPGVEELYWRARYYWEQRFPGATHLAYQTLTQALERDPEFAPAHAFMAVIYSHKTAPYLGIGDDDTFDLVEREIALAGEQAAYIPETYIARALVAFFRDNDPATAFDILNGVPEGLTDQPLVLQTKAMTLSTLGRFNESLALVDRALDLDPFSESINWDRVWFLYLAGENERALEAAANAAAFSEDPHLSYVGLILSSLGREREALQAWIDYHVFRGVFGAAEKAHLETFLDDPEAGYDELVKMVDARADTYTPHTVFRIAWLAMADRPEAAKAELAALGMNRDNWLSQWKGIIPAFATLRE